MSPLDRPLAITFFASAGASQKTDELISLRQLVPRILATTKPEKRWLPWLKLAKFGDVRNPHETNPPERWSLRHDKNVLGISGVEGDYDHKVTSVAEAVAVLAGANLAGMIYTSPSHTEDAPCWRVLCPLSRDHYTATRATYMARVNGLFQGSLADESFTLSQSYYYGSVNSNPSHACILVDGDFLDQREDLDAGAIGRPHADFVVTPQPLELRAENSSAFIEAVLKNAIGKVRNAVDGQKHHTLRAQARLLGGYSHASDYSQSDVVEWLMDALPPSAKDRKAARVTAIYGFQDGLATPISIPALTPRLVRDNTPPPDWGDDPGFEAADEDLGHAEVQGNNVVDIATAKKAKKPKRKIPDDWRSEWHRSEEGSPLPTLHNVMTALRCHDQLMGIVRYDEMMRAPILAAPIPDAKHDQSVPRHLRDADTLAIQEAIQRVGLRRIAKGTVQDAIRLRASEQSYHPVRDYLDSLEWDGEKRIRGWLGKYLGVEGGVYSDTIGRLFLIALVARIYRPGCKSDYMLILEGPQGALKSTACRVLAGEWFSDNLPNLTHGDAVRLSMHLRGKWLIEIGELASFASASGTESLKAFLTQTDERYTPKYAENEAFEPRQCIFIGSTNEKAYLRDATGGRRFWPVKVGDIDIQALRADRDQLMAEAAVEFKNGANWWPDKEFEADMIVPQQEARYEEDPWETEIKDWIKRELVRQCTTNEILRGALSMSAEKFGTREIRRVSAILGRIGWTRNLKKNGRPYEPPASETWNTLDV